MANLVIDVSNNRPATINTLRDSKAVAVICKATEGGTFEDKTLGAHRASARALGVPFGSYLFLHPSSPGSEAGLYLEYAKPKKGDIQPIIDAEVNDGSSFAVVAARVERCATALEHAGYKPILYASADFWKRLFAEKPDLKRLRVWEAQYPGTTPVAKWYAWLLAKRIKLQHGVSVVLWQFTDRYLVDGRGYDMSVLLAPLDSLLIDT